MQESKGKAEPRPHVLTIEEKKRVTVTGVESVTAFSPQQISLALDNGRMTITGNNFRVTAFSKANGTFSADGAVTGVKYGSLSGIKRLFR